MPTFPDARDIEEVSSTLALVTDTARTRDARWGLFAGLYAAVTRAIARGIDDGRFEDGPRMSRFDAAFANRYFAALRLQLAGERPARAWRVAFEADDRDDLTALQHLLLGVNAHINVDLGFAVVEAGLDPQAFRSDFLEVNAILADVLGQAQAVLGEVSTALAGLDRLLGTVDAYLGLFVLARARDQAWRTAVIADALAPAGDDALEMIVDRGAAHLGCRIADPGFPISATVRLVRASESWTVSSLLDGFDALHTT